MIIKNGIEFNEQQQKFRQGVKCDICDKKLQKGDKEYVSKVSPVMHLCPECANSDKNIRGKKGTSIFVNNRFYMFVQKGINGNHICDMTGKTIEQGTPCWWSSKKDDPEKKCSSYILTLEEQTTKQEVENKVVQNDLQTWYDEAYVDVGTKHFNEDTSHFCSFIQVEAEKVLKLKNNYLNMKDYIELTQNKYLGVVFWLTKGIIDFVPYQRLMKFFDEYELTGKLNGLKIHVEDLILERYCKEGEVWKRIMIMQK